MAVSLAVHLLTAAALIVGPRFAWSPPPPAEPATIQLLMVEQKGAEAGAPAPARPEQQQQQQSADEQAPDVASPGQVAAPVPAPKPEPQTQQATPPPAPEALTIDLNGTDSDTNAIAFNVIPARPDDRFRNRPPAYPDDAARRGEHGKVELLVHVSAGGYAVGADVVESSGSASLDKAAVDAVRKWRFRPAIREGKAVPNDMPFLFDFTLN